MGSVVFVYRRRSTLFIVPVARNARGGHVEVDPVQVVSDAATPEEVWSSLHLALVAADREVDVPVAAIVSPVLAHASVSSWRQFVKGAVCCCVEKREDTLTVTPLPRAAGGFVFDVDRAVAVDQAGPEVAVRAMRGVLDSLEG